MKNLTSNLFIAECKSFKCALHFPKFIAPKHYNNLLVVFTLILLCSSGIKVSAQQATPQPGDHFTTVNYTYDNAGNRWKRNIQFTVNKRDTSQHPDTATSNKLKPYKENVADSFSIKQVIIYPNPTDGLLKLDIQGALLIPLVGEIVIMASDGSTVLTSQVMGEHNDIDLSPFADGNYWLNISINGEKRSYSLVKK